MLVMLPTVYHSVTIGVADEETGGNVAVVVSPPDDGPEGRQADAREEVVHQGAGMREAVIDAQGVKQPGDYHRWRWVRV